MNALKALAILIGVTACVSPALASPEIGKPAPDFTATDSHGAQVHLGDFKSKIVVLEWTNDGCPYVQKHYASHNMQTLQKEATQDGVVWLSVISSAPGQQGFADADKANALTETRDAAPTAVLLDPQGRVGHLYEAQTTPHLFIVDKTGMLVYKGGIDDKPTSNPADIASAKNFVRAALDDLKAGGPVRVSVSRPYGCSVKYDHE